MMDLGTAHLVALGIAVIAAAWDIRTRRIPNWLVFGASCAGLIFHGSTHGVPGVLHSGAGWLLGIVVFIVPFALRGLGGGDVKLLGALGAWIGPADVFWLALYTGAAGGILAILVALTYGYLRRAMANVWLLLCHWRVAGLQALPEITLEKTTAPKLAYAVPILIGTVAVIWLR